ncbi:S9 family peptidase [Arenimonas sp.]|uniref:S9 family peptidase n=1 Tax=Arenimonas sp. TaxID=1872635 RepID=UPI0039C88925
MRSMMVKSCLLGALTAVVSTGAAAQTRALTASDYQRAENALSYRTVPLIDHAASRLTWRDDGTLTWLDSDAGGGHWMQVDPATGKAMSAFDQDKLYSALSAATGKPVKSNLLAPPISDFTRGSDGRWNITTHGQHYLCDLGAKASCSVAAAGPKTGDEPGVLAPDGKHEAFIRNWNLWLRDVATGKESALTTDGIKDFGYATDNAGWTHSDRAVLVWSPDSKQIATFQQDQRKTGEMTTVGTGVGHPHVETWKYPLVGDKDITMIERVVIRVDSPHVLRLKMPPDQHRSSLCDDVSCFGGWEDVQWAADGRSLGFVSTSRDHTQTWMRVANTETGAVREVFNEKVATYFESGNGAVNWRYLPESQEVIWFSERNNWGNLYLYDLASGKLKQAITTGEGNVSEVLRVDAKSRTLWFRGVGKERGRDPYFQHFYKIGFDGKGLTLLTPEDADHEVLMSSDGKYFVDTWSTVATAPVTTLRRSDDGSKIAELAHADLTRLRASGWVAPEPFTATARDGKTLVYGQMFKPSNFDASKKYPIVDYIYPGPQTGSVRSRSFLPAHGDNQALAELGFIVVAIDGMGTPWRSKAFHDAYFQNIGDNTLPDQVAALHELGKRYSWIDMDRVGVWGHSGGGNATATAMFRYPDLFKVGIAESGNHDNRNYEDDWAEKWQGLLRQDKDGKSNYDDQANQNHAANLKGHLLLAHGLMDDNVPPSNTLLVVDALIKANKDFDLLLIPNAHHGYGAASLYMARKRWDYFVRYLMGAEPPKQYELKMPKPN